MTMDAEAPREPPTHSKSRLGDEPRGAFTCNDEVALTKLRSGSPILMVGLSFSMTSYSDPCLYNYDICDAIRQDLSTAQRAGAEPFLYVQWEIADAASDDPNFPWRFLPNDHVCEPHLILPEQIVAPRAILEQLSTADATAVTPSPLRVLKRKLEDLWGATGVRLDELAAEKDDARLRQRLAANLNGLLADPDFRIPFSGLVDLKNLRRTLHGKDWWEIRDLPPSTHKVRKYQARRLGVFILEAVLSRAILTPSEYISTRSVLEGMMEQARRERFLPDYIFLYAHEAHAPRARWQLCEKTWASTTENAYQVDWLLPPKRIVYRGGSDRWGQPGNAQDWTDDEDKWNVYNGIEAAE